MKKKRIISKILVVIVCLTIVLTLFIVPCYASGVSFGNSSASREYHVYRGIPWNITAGLNTSNTNPNTSLFIENVGSLDFVKSYNDYYRGGFSSKVSLVDGDTYLPYEYTPSSRDFNNVSAGQFISLNPSNLDFGIPYLSSSSSSVDYFDSVALFTDSRILEVMNDSYYFDPYYADPWAELLFATAHVADTAENFYSYLGVNSIHLSYSGLFSNSVVDSSTTPTNCYIGVLGDFPEGTTFLLRFYSYFDHVTIHSGDLVYNDSEIGRNITVYENTDVIRSYNDYLDVYCSTLDHIGIDFSLFEFDLSVALDPILESMLMSNYRASVTIVPSNPPIHNPYVSEAYSMYGGVPYFCFGFNGSNISNDYLVELNSVIADDFYTDGVADGSPIVEHEYVSLEEFNLVDWLGDTLGGVMSTRIIGPITIGSILYVAVGVGFVMLVLKFFAGG